MKNLQKSLDKARTRMGKLNKISIEISTMNLNALRRDFHERFKIAVDREENLEKKPATFCYKEILKMSPLKQDKFIIQQALHSKCADITMKELAMFS